MVKCVVALVVACGILAAQEAPVVLEGDTTLHKKYKVDFAVPDLPAFQVLGTDPVELLRPSTPELLSVVGSNLLEGQLIPKSLALEIAPLMMLRANKLTLAEFDRNRVLYSLRLSVGTTSEEPDSGIVTKRAGLGLRMTLLDKGDLRANGDYRAEVLSMLLARGELKDSLQRHWLNRRKLVAADLAETREGQKKLAEANEYAERKVTEYDEAELEKRLAGKTFDERLDIVKQEYKAKNWNAQKWDIAAAGLLSQDSATAEIAASRASFWTTYAHPLWTWGQALAGVTVNWFPQAADSEETSVLAGLRLYGGINALKAMVECQYENVGFERHDLLVNTGAEVMVWSGIWVDASLGVEWPDISQGTESHLVTDLGVKFTPGEKMELF